MNLQSKVQPLKKIDRQPNIDTIKVFLSVRIYSKPAGFNCTYESRRPFVFNWTQN